MKVKKALHISSLIVFLLFGQSATAFDASSLSGCYVTSQYGNLLGPQFTVDAAGALVPDNSTLVLHGTASVGLVCLDGGVGDPDPQRGIVTEVSATQNIAGLCVVNYTGSGSYIVDPTGRAAASLSTTIPADAVLAPGCAQLGVQAGGQATFDYSFALDGQGCAKAISVSAVGPAGAIPIVTEGEACLQVAPQ